VRDYGRIDLRLTEEGEVYVIEVNASCYLEKSSEFAAAAAAGGLDFPTLVNRVVELAVERRRVSGKDPKRARPRGRRERREAKLHPATV